MDGQFNRNGQSGARSGTGTSPVAKMTEQVGEVSGQVKAAVADFGRKTVDNLDAHRGPAAGTLDRTASVLHQQAEKAAGVAHATADTMNATAETLHATADYVRKHDMKAMAEDVTDMVRRYPGAALAVAGVAGFLVARVFRTRG